MRPINGLVADDVVGAGRQNAGGGGGRMGPMAMGHVTPGAPLRGALSRAGARAGGRAGARARARAHTHTHVCVLVAACVCVCVCVCADVKGGAAWAHA